MALRPFRRIQTSDKELNQVQDHLRGSLDPLMQAPFAQARLLKAVPLAAGTNTVSHGLGRPYLSVFPGIPSAASTLTLAASPDASKVLSVVASAPCIVDLAVL